MTVRRINFTARKRIRERDVEIQLDTIDGNRIAFELEADLEGYDFPTEAQIFVEAYRASRFERFEFGTLGSVRMPLRKDLRVFQAGEAVLFRLKVIDSGEHHGILLGEADRLNPVAVDRSPGGRVPLLPAESKELGPLVWRLDLEDTPLLQVNRKVGDWRGLVTSKAFACIVYPKILQDILLDIVIAREITPDGDMARSEQLWFKFASTLRGAPTFPTGTASGDELRGWVEGVVDAFAGEQNSLRTAIQAFGGDN